MRLLASALIFVALGCVADPLPEDDRSGARPAVPGPKGGGAATESQDGASKGPEDGGAATVGQGGRREGGVGGGWPQDATDWDIRPAGGPTAYRLIQRRNLASPLPDPTGITHDGQNFWIIAGGHNARTHTLVRFDPERLMTDRRFMFDNLIEKLGTGVYGITWDGQSVWISVSGSTNKLARVDPTTGRIIRTISSASELGPSDLDFDGRDLWLSTGTGDVLLIDAVTGGMRRRFATTAHSQGRDHGVAFRPGELWVGNLFGGMDVHDPSSGAWMGAALHETGRRLSTDEVGASCFVGPQLVMVSRLGITYYDTERAR